MEAMTSLAISLYTHVVKRSMLDFFIFLENIFYKGVECCLDLGQRLAFDF